MALDHPARVTRLAVLDIVPTGEMWARADRAFAWAYWHWGFLSQPAPLPERLIAADPDAFFEHHVRRIGLGADGRRYPEAVLSAYRAQLDDAAIISGICEDYRAGATIDAQHDAAGGTITCPVLVLWATRGAMEIFYEDVLEVWRPWATDLRGGSVDASHFLVEDEPEAVAAELMAFFAES
jgi:haloacetate dehalogenase